MRVDVKRKYEMNVLGFPVKCDIEPERKFYQFEIYVPGCFTVVFSGNSGIFPDSHVETETMIEAMALKTILERKDKIIECIVDKLADFRAQTTDTEAK